MPPVTTRLLSSSTPLIRRPLCPCVGRQAKHGYRIDEALLALGLDPGHLDVLDAARRSGRAGTTRPSTRRARRRPRRRPRRCRPEHSNPAARDRASAPGHASRPGRRRPGPAAARRPRARFISVEAALADERHEPARDRADDRRALGAAHDQLQPLAPAPADRHGEPATRLELLVELLAAGPAPPPRRRSRRTGACSGRPSDPSPTCTRTRS